MKKNNVISFLICFFILSCNVHANGLADTVVIDNIRNLQINEATTLTIDRRSIPTVNASEQFGTGFFSRTLPGFKAQMNYTDDGSGTNGSLSEINLVNSVVGPVTANDENSFSVLTLNLVVNADTVIEGVDELSEIATGDIVAASGIENEDGTVKATRIEVFETTPPYWLATGDISNLTNDSFDIDTLNILLFSNNMETLIICNGEIENGTKVIVELVPQPDYVQGNAVDAMAVICYEDFDTPVDPPNGVFFNGDIEEINNNGSVIVVDGNVVNITVETQIISESGDTTLEVGMNVSINGFEDENTNEVTAEFIIITGDFPIPPPGPTVLFGHVSDVNGDTFMLKGETVQVTDSTQYFNGTATDLVDGAFVQVLTRSEEPSGNEPPGSVLIAEQVTFIDNFPIGDFVTLQGEVSNLNNDFSQFNIDTEVVNVGPETQIFGGSLQDLANGLNVIVEGLRDETSGEVNAGFILLDNGNPIDPPAHVCVAGSITSVNADQTQFELDNGAIINVTADTDFFQGSQADLVVGADVEIGGIPSDDSNEITAEVIFFTPEPGPENVFFIGFITAIADDNSQITVGDQIVNITENTVINGSVDALAIGIEVLVVGLFNPANNEIDAESITIPNSIVLASAPVRPEDVTLSTEGNANGSLVIMGLEVEQTELTADPMGLFSNGLTEESNVLLYGIQDSEGGITANLVLISSGDNGGPFTRILLQGKVSAVDSDAVSLSVLGVNIGNLDNATYVDEDGQSTTAAEFLADLNAGDVVTVADAESYDPTTNTLNAGTILKGHGGEGGNLPTPNNRAVGDSISGSGIVTRVIEDRIFANSF